MSNSTIAAIPCMILTSPMYVCNIHVGTATHEVKSHVAGLFQRDVSNDFSLP